MKTWSNFVAIAMAPAGYRRRAAELRIKAEEMVDGETKRGLRSTAEKYDQLAASIEGIASSSRN